VNKKKKKERKESEVKAIHLSKAASCPFFFFFNHKPKNLLVFFLTRTRQFLPDRASHLTKKDPSYEPFFVLN